MYSSEFRKWCNRYLQGSDIKIRSGAQKTELLSGRLNNCAYCDMEASENELRIICGNVDLYGIDATMAMVADATSIADLALEGEFEEIAEEASNKRLVNARELPSPAEYTLLTANTAAELEILVNTFLDGQTWHFVGGVSVAANSHEVLFSQALCRY